MNDRADDRLTGLRTWIARCAAAWRALRAAARAREQLETMSDRELADLAISRADIRRVARMQTPDPTARPRAAGAQSPIRQRSASAQPPDCAASA